MDLNLTGHSELRMKERCGLNNRKEMRQMQAAAWNSNNSCGEIAKFCPQLSDYMRQKLNRNGNTCKMRYYKGYLFIWKGKKNHRLVTVHPVSDTLVKAYEESYAKYQQDQKVHKENQQKKYEAFLKSIQK